MLDFISIYEEINAFEKDRNLQASELTGYILEFVSKTKRCSRDDSVTVPPQSDYSGNGCDCKGTTALESSRIIVRVVQ